MRNCFDSEVFSMADVRTIDTRLEKQLQTACALCGVSIVGVPGGWSVVVKVGMSEKHLGTQRTGMIQRWRSLDTLMDYLRDELCIVKIDGIDTNGYSAAACSCCVRLVSGDVAATPSPRTSPQSAATCSLTWSSSRTKRRRLRPI